MKDGRKARMLILLVIAALSWVWAGVVFWQNRVLSQRWGQLSGEDMNLSQKINQARERVIVATRLVGDIGQPLEAIQPGQTAAKMMARLEGILQRRKIRLETIQPLSWQVMDQEGYLKLPIQFSATTAGNSVKDGLKAVTEMLKDLKLEKPPAFLERFSMELTQEKKFRIQGQVAWFYPLSQKILREYRKTDQTRPRLRS